VILEIHDNFKQPQRISCTRLVVRDKYNNPLAVAVETAPDITTIASLQDPDFYTLLKLLGITDSVVVTSI
ncbi:MAG: hypothetical protein WDA42_05460, partial [Candidatus Bathyarchaeia archaeon]|jgi:hypothetical protein